MGSRLRGNDGVEIHVPVADILHGRRAGIAMLRPDGKVRPYLNNGKALDRWREVQDCSVPFQALILYIPAHVRQLDES